jgi:pyridoxal phosphate enzyme (YggS family)
MEKVEKRIVRACARAGRPRETVRLIAITKTHPVETLQTLIDIGVKDIGENRVQEIAAKAPLLRGDVTLHMVGHLQTNKVAQVLLFGPWIQSIDSERLVARIEHCHAGATKINALVEVNTSGEALKSGCRPDECRALCERVQRSGALELRGLMSIGPLAGGEAQVRESFVLLRRLSEQCGDRTRTMELSMGMSGDFEWAIEEGTTMIRIGSALLGERTV